VAKRSSRTVALAATLALGASLLTACGSTGSAPSSNPANQSLVLLQNYDVTSMDPAIAYDPPSSQVVSLAYGTLLTLKGSSTDLAPGLATAWSSADGGKVWTFTLRKGVKFADGTAFNSQAVKFAFERTIKMNQGPAWMLDVIQSIATPAPDKLVITLKYPYQPFIYSLAQPAGTAIVSPAGVKKHGDGWFQNHTDGTGPYQASQWVHGQQVVMTRNPDYWQGWSGNHFQKVILKIVTEPSTQQMLLQTGSADMNIAFPVSQVAQVQGQKGIKVLTEPGLNILFIGLNNKSGPTANQLVRQALSYTLDYKGAVQQIYSGYAQQAKGPIPPSLWGYDNALPQYHLDLQKAKALLAQAGYPHGFPMTITVEENPLYQQVVESWQSTLKQVGINATIDTMPWATEYKKLTTLSTAPTAFITGWYADFADPDDFLYPQYASSQQGSVGFNLEWYGNPTVDRLLNQARTEPDHQKRIALYAQVQQILEQQAPVLWVLDQKTAVVERSTVHGYVYNALWPVNAYAMYKD